MHWNPLAFRFSGGVALTALLIGTVLPPAVAQPAPPPLPTPGSTPLQPALNRADPPERVGRVASVSGTVSFHNAGDEAWTAASANYPVSSGNTFWTEPAARLRLEISDGRITLAGGAEFEVASLDAAGMQGVASRGEIYLMLRDSSSAETWSVQTPRGLVTLNGPGRFDIVVGTTEDPTLITVVDGSADIQGPDVTLHVTAGQTATLTGTDTFRGSIGSARHSPFLTGMLNAERPRARAPLPQQVSATVTAMPGGDDLETTGQWNEAPQYGEVWYPPVDPGWVPYRHGHWAYVAPWGWTWIDEASWGFAPFHYGRWVEIDNRWAWTPGEVHQEYHRPVYAPALVAFIGLGAGVAIGAALASRSVGWVPLGPHEAYRPWYHASNDYVRQVNISHVNNVTNVTNNTMTTINFINHAGATSVPAAAMVNSRPVAAVARPVSVPQFAAAPPVLGRQPISPTAATAGVTPLVARQLNLAPVAVPHAPGPVIQAQAAETRHAPEGRPAPPPRFNAGAPPGPADASGVRTIMPVPAQSTTPGISRPGAAQNPMPGGAPVQAGGLGAPGRLPPLPQYPAPAPATAPAPLPNVIQPPQTAAPPTNRPNAMPRRYGEPPDAHIVQPGAGVVQPRQNPAPPAAHVEPVPQQHFAPPPARIEPPRTGPQPQVHVAPSTPQAQPYVAPLPQPHFAPPPPPHAAPPPLHEATPHPTERPRKPNER